MSRIGLSLSPSCGVLSALYLFSLVILNAKSSVSSSSSRRLANSLYLMHELYFRLSLQLLSLVIGLREQQSLIASSSSVLGITCLETIRLSACICHFTLWFGWIICSFNFHNCLLIFACSKNMSFTCSQLDDSNCSSKPLYCDCSYSI